MREGKFKKRKNSIAENYISAYLQLSRYQIFFTWPLTCQQPGKQSVSRYPCIPFPHINFYLFFGIMVPLFKKRGVKLSLFRSSSWHHVCSTGGNMEAYSSSVTCSMFQEWWLAEAEENPSFCTSSLPDHASQIWIPKARCNVSRTRSWFACLACEGTACS